MNIKIKFICMSIIILGLIVNTASFSDVAFAEKPDKEDAKVTREDAKVTREDAREDAKVTREDAKVTREDAKVTREDAREDAKDLREDAKDLREEIKEFRDGTVVSSSSTSGSSVTEKVTICHIPPGNPGNAHTITVGSPAVRAHEAHGDFVGGSCESMGFEEFRDSVVVTSSSTSGSSVTEKVTICHIPPGNPGNAHTITVGSPAVRAHEAHGDFVDGSCESMGFEEFKDNLAEKESTATDSDENVIQNLQRQIANLEKMLQDLLDSLFN